jgi:hypothetical protein
MTSPLSTLSSGDGGDITTLSSPFQIWRLPTIDVAPLFQAEGTDIDDTVHIKGFGSRLQFGDPATEEMVADILSSLTRAKLVVWDGDPLRPDSFTALIPKVVALQRSLGKNVRLAAFRRDNPESVASFKNSWVEFARQLEDPIHLILVPDDMKSSTTTPQQNQNQTVAGGGSPRVWAELGLIAFEHSHARRSVVLGGGDTCRIEVGLSPSVRFDVWCATRPNGDGTEESALKTLAPCPRNVHLH